MDKQLKKISDATKIIDDYIDYATIEGESKLNGDYKTGNIMAKKLNKLFNMLEKDNALAQEVIGTLLKCDSIRARSLSAVDALRLNIFVDDAVTTLQVISKRGDIIGFGCEMALKIWQGEVPGKTL